MPSRALSKQVSFWWWWPPHENMPLAKDLLHPSSEERKRKHKKKCLVQSPSSYFMDVKCPGCYKITTVFSHAQTVVLCVGCSTVLCQPTGRKARLTEGCSFRWKQHQKYPVSRWMGNHPNKHILDTKTNKQKNKWGKKLPFCGKSIVTCQLENSWWTGFSLKSLCFSEKNELSSCI